MIDEEEHKSVEMQSREKKRSNLKTSKFGSSPNSSGKKHIHFGEQKSDGVRDEGEKRFRFDLAVGSEMKTLAATRSDGSDMISRMKQQHAQSSWMQIAADCDSKSEGVSSPGQKSSNTKSGNDSFSPGREEYLDMDDAELQQSRKLVGRMSTVRKTMMGQAKADVQDSFSAVLGKASGFLGGIIIALFIVCTLVIFTHVEETGVFHQWIHNKKLQMYTPAFLEKHILKLIAEDIGGKTHKHVQSDAYFAMPPRNATEKSSFPCITYYKTKLETYLSTVQGTEPKYVNIALQNMYLSDFPELAEVGLDTYLKQSVPFNLDATCFQQPMFEELACRTRESQAIQEDFSRLTENEIFSMLYTTMTYLTVVDTITTNALRKPWLASKIINHLSHNYMEDLLDLAKKSTDDKKQVEKMTTKLYVMKMLTARLFDYSKATTTDTWLEKTNQELQLNTLLSALQSVEAGDLLNANLGVMLFSSSNGLPNFNTDGGAQILQFPFGSSFAKTYIPSYTISQLSAVKGKSAPMLLPTLLQSFIPSVMCAASTNTNGAANFFQTHTFASTLFMFHKNQTMFQGEQYLLGGIPVFTEASATNFRKLWQQVVAERTTLAQSKRKTITEDLFTIGLETPDLNDIGDGWMLTSPVSRLSHHDFLVFLTLIIWITTVWAGLQTELFVGIRLLTFESDLEDTHWYYFYSQIFFPLGAVVCFLSQSPFVLPLLVVTLWKFGVPETLAYLTKAFFVENKNLPIVESDLTRKKAGLLKDDKSESECENRESILFFQHTLIEQAHEWKWWAPFTSADRFTAFCSGLGTLLHHTAAAYVICSMITKLIKMDAAVTACIVPLVFQHNIMMLKYLSTTLYVIVQLCLEAWWEWELFSFIQTFTESSVVIAATCMLIAHWLYLTGMAFDLFVVSENPYDDNLAESQSFFVRQHTQLRRSIMNRQSEMRKSVAFLRNNTMENQCPSPCQGIHLITISEDKPSHYGQHLSIDVSENVQQTETQSLKTPKKYLDDDDADDDSDFSDEPSPSLQPVTSITVTTIPSTGQVPEEAEEQIIGGEVLTPLKLPEYTKEIDEAMIEEK